MKSSPEIGGHRAPRVIMVGLDGATFDLIEPLVKAGKLPTLAKLMDEGSRAVLRSTIPPVTIPAWVSMLTGKNPGKLGVFDLLRREGYKSEPNSVLFRGRSSLWQLLNDYGVSVGLLNIPGTYPPEKVDGFMISGMLTPSKRSKYSYPEGLASDMESSIDDYEIDVPQWQYFDEEAFVKDIHKVTDKRERAAEFLTEAMPTDFFMVVFTSSDRLQHVLWDKATVVEEYWAEMDRVLGRFLSRMGEDTTVLVVSDHGFGPIRRTFYVNEWLRERGYLRVKGSRSIGILTRLGMVVEWLYRNIRKLPLVTPVLRLINEVVGFERLRRYTYDYLSNEHLVGRVAWRRTQAFSGVHSPHFGHIYINVREEMPRGVVSPRDREAVREAIIRDLKGLRDPETGESLRTDVYRREELYSGEYVEVAPDIVFMVEGGTYEVDSKVGDGRIFAEGAPFTGWTGTHTREGLFIARGPNISRGKRIGDADIIDVAPTIFRIFGIPTPEDLDGRSLDEIFENTGLLTEREKIVKTRGDLDEPFGLSEDEKALIEERLRKLGYIS